MNNNQAMQSQEEEYLNEPEPVKNIDEDDQYNESQEFNQDDRID